MAKLTVNFDKDYGPSISGGWVPAPRFALRRNRIVALSRNMPAGELLETGPGAGAMLRDFALRGFKCTGYDTSDCAREVAQSMVQDIEKVTIVSCSEADWLNRFDYLLSCEVLEHIEDDQSALNEWVSYLKPEGIAIIAVPCHMKKFGALDDWAGHLRRYEKVELEKLLNNAGLQISHFETYGFPLANLTSFLRNFMLRNNQKNNIVDNAESTAKSGIERKAENKLYKFQTHFIGRLIMRFAFTLQYLFNRTELGDGFIVVAHKKSLHE